MRIIYTLLALLYSFSSLAQLKHRIIFIGDAGEVNHEQEMLIPKAAALVVPNKTIAFFLGDNIYPTGMGLPGDADRERTEKILKSQFLPMREAGAPVYFIPGNHDWDRMSKRGLEKIRAQGAFLEAQKDSLLQLVPKNGCPDPVEIQVSENTVIITFDSEWFVFTHARSSADITCACTTEKQVFARIKDLLAKNKDKQVFLTAHHPLRTYGVHGGYYSWKDHIFPLRVAHHKLYIPLPIIGSLYPALRNTLLLNPEDMGHQLYKNYMQGMREVIQTHPNVIFISGHDHGLQLIEDPDFLQVVSGSGAKSTYLKKGHDALYTYENQGFVTLDEMENGNTEITFYTIQDGQVSAAYSYSKPFTTKGSAKD